MCSPHHKSESFCPFQLSLLNWVSLILVPPQQQFSQKENRMLWGTVNEYLEDLTHAQYPPNGICRLPILQSNIHTFSLWIHFLKYPIPLI